MLIPSRSKPASLRCKPLCHIGNFPTWYLPPWDHHAASCPVSPPLLRPFIIAMCCEWQSGLVWAMLSPVKLHCMLLSLDKEAGAGGSDKSYAFFSARSGGCIWKTSWDYWFKRVLFLNGFCWCVFLFYFNATHLQNSCLPWEMVFESMAVQEINWMSELNNLTSARTETAFI